MNKHHPLRHACAVISMLVALPVLAADYVPPKLADGTPDLQGIWSNVSVTQLIRSPMYKSNRISQEDADKVEAQRIAAAKAGLKPTDPNAPKPSSGGNVGGYNSFWADAGERLAMIDGEYRTTWLVDPDNGKLPYTAEGLKMFSEKQAFSRNNFDNPESRPMAERCIVGFGSTGGPPMINVLYNNNYQIVQTPDTVMILVEMNHDARIIRMNDKPLPEGMNRWLGDSIGRWDGNTLVVETTGFHPDESLRLNFNQSFYLSHDAKVTERFTRISDKEIFYEFTVKDPAVYKQPWKAEMIFNAAEGQIFEYACHEGNYALPGILAGARKDESEKK